MVTTFLHEDKPRSPDELPTDETPFCNQCGEPMWMTSVSKTIADHGTDGTYVYECRYCGGRKTVNRHTAHGEGPPIAPDIR